MGVTHLGPVPRVPTYDMVSLPMLWFHNVGYSALSIIPQGPNPTWPIGKPPAGLLLPV